MSAEAPERIVSGLTSGAMPPAVGAFYANTVKLSATVVTAVRALWSQIDYGDLEGSWAAIAPQLLQLVSAGQLAAAGGAEAYLAACLAQLGIDATAFGTIAPSMLAGMSADGRSLLGELHSPIVTVKRATAVGILGDRALQAGLAALVTIADTAVVDMARQAVSVGMAARPAVTGYVRAVNAGACARCVVLAGRAYRWSVGFDRHPRCHCKNVPTTDKIARDLVTDPHAYVKGLGQGERERILGKGAAAAFEQGANLGQLVNSRRGGVRKTTLYGQGIEYTLEGVTRRGMYGRMQQDLVKLGGVRYDANRAPRLTPDAILDLADGDRAESVRLLKRYGYLID